MLRPSREKWRSYAAALIVVTIITIAFVFNSIESELVYEGEVWGDFVSTGDIVGYDNFDDRWYFIRSRHGTGSNGHLYIEVSNISGITMSYWEDGVIHETAYTLNNRSLLIDASFDGYFAAANLRNANIRYDFREFSGLWADEFTYAVYMDFDSINGTAQLRHDPREESDFSVNWETFVYFDNITLTNKGAYYTIPSGEVADIRILGSGICEFYTNPEVHINGSLTVEDFNARKNHEILPRPYDRLRIEGDDIVVRTRSQPDFNSLKGHDYWDPWVIEIFVPERRDVEIQSTMGWMNTLCWALIIVAGIIVYVYITNNGRQSAPPPRNPIDEGNPEREHDG